MVVLPAWAASFRAEGLEPLPRRLLAWGRISRFIEGARGRGARVDGRIRAIRAERSSFRHRLDHRRACEARRASTSVTMIGRRSAEGLRRAVARRAHRRLRLPRHADRPEYGSEPRRLVVHPEVKQRRIPHDTKVLFPTEDRPAAGASRSAIDAEVHVASAARPHFEAKMEPPHAVEGEWANSRAPIASDSPLSQSPLAPEFVEKRSNTGHPNTS